MGTNIPFDTLFGDRIANN